MRNVLHPCVIPVPLCQWVINTVMGWLEIPRSDTTVLDEKFIIIIIIIISILEPVFLYRGLDFLTSVMFGMKNCVYIFLLSS